MEYFSAADRNKEHILGTLKKHFAETQDFFVLEIGSGTGQHTTYFAKAFPSSTWQPSDTDGRMLASISNYMKACALMNVKQPIYLDASKPPEQWQGLKLGSCDLITAINIIHITPYSVCQGLLKGAAAYLKQKGLLFMYGPYAVDGELTPASNVQFDEYLKKCCTEWGVRDTKDVTELAQENGLDLIKMYDMPANNKTLIFQKR